MRVRPADPKDADSLGAALKSVVDEERWLGIQPPVSATEMADRILGSMADGAPVFVLVDDAGEPIGAIDLRPTRIDGVWSIGMWIVASHRGEGGGRMLLEAAIDARPPKVHKIELETWPDNEAAIGLYERFGFEREGLRRHHYRRRDGRLRSSLIMARLFLDDSGPSPSGSGPR